MIKKWFAGVVPLVALACILASPSATHAQGFSSVADASNYAVLYEGNGGNSLQFNNSNVTGNIGIGATGITGLSSGTITGNINFSAANTGQYSNSGATVTGSINYSVSAVQTDLNALNSLSQKLGLESGTSTTITSGGSINASAGVLDSSGNRVFTVTAISFANGTFTINGTASQYVVLNVAGSVGSNGLNGSIVLAGGITSDHVLINYTPSTSNLTTYNNDYASLTGGPTLTISTSGLTTTGTFLDPTGNIQVNHTVLDGRLFGGDTQNISIVSGANVFAPGPFPPSAVPEPSTIALALSGVFGFGLAGLRRFRRQRAGAVA